MSLSRAQFETACQLFLQKQGDAPDKVKWEWCTYPVHSLSTAQGAAQLQVAPQLGYLTRSISVCRHGELGAAEIHVDSDLTEDDESILNGVSAPCTAVVQQYIVYSPTFGVPSFYFSMYDHNGAPLPLHDVIKTSLFRLQALPDNVNTEPHAVTLPDSQFPLLSFGDHPVLGISCWYFHPCETSSAIREILEATGETIGDRNAECSDRFLTRWLEAWFLVLGSVIDLR